MYKYDAHTMGVEVNDEVLDIEDEIVLNKKNQKNKR